MKAAVVDRYGPPEAVQVREVATPTPAARQVLLRVHAASVNDWDWGILQGSSVADRLMNGLWTPRVKVLGCDVAGRVEATGADVLAFRPGDEVYGDLSGSGFGALAEYVCAPETSLVRKPPAMSFEQAAAIPQAAMLAVQGLVDAGRIRAGQTCVERGGRGCGHVRPAARPALRRGGDGGRQGGQAGHAAVDGRASRRRLRRGGLHDWARRYDLILDVKTNRSPLAYLRALEPGGVYATVGGHLSAVLQAVVLIGRWLARSSEQAPSCRRPEAEQGPRPRERAVRGRPARDR